ncbi:uncharacterized protein LOC122500713 [Leptopilina heterotoma]|uniref:uncharacterized protein LOC122500713 n=1 Tax=Leptopilina heterotoma TaxID=63436 RepID=UPI001CA843BC|nr:uncharacterized protein LOC122500713 [Leptopilina heterotoma]
MCNRTAHSFGNLKDDFAPITPFLQLGLGLLHCEIKSFEHLLHLAYRNKEEIRQWDMKVHLKEQFNEQKKIIQKRLFDDFGIKADLLNVAKKLKI